MTAPFRWSTRHAEVLAMAAAGLSSKETGRRLYISTETVKTYKKQAYLMLGARNSANAVALALRKGLIQ